MRKLYEVIMLMMIAVSVSVAWTDYQYARQIDLVIWAIFVVDYALRFRMAADKKKFFKSHILDLIAIIPLDSMFLSLRIIQFFRVFRLGIYAYRYAAPFLSILNTNGLSRVLVFTLATVIVGGSVINIIEPEIESVWDGMWWAIVTTTTVGYGDISPKTAIGRIIASVLMLVGIGTVGMITGSIATHFLTQKESETQATVKQIQNTIMNADHLTDADLKFLIGYLEALAEHKRAKASDEQTDWQSSAG